MHSAAEGADQRLRLALRELQTDTQAALLRLDPIADRDEYAELATLLAEERPPTLEALMATDRPEARRLATRISNLGLHSYGIWARGEPGSVLDALEDDGPRCLVVDLGSLPTREEQARRRRRPCSAACGACGRDASRCWS